MLLPLGFLRHPPGERYTQTLPLGWTSCLRSLHLALICHASWN